jgi:hypothetical protein
MLQTALDTHPEINCYGEILNPGSNDTLLDRFSSDQAINYVFQENEKGSGFIIHRHRMDLSPIWEALAANKQVKVIFINRTDQLRRYASLKKARLTKKWIDKTGEPAENRKVKFDKQEFYREYTNYMNNLSGFIQRFHEHDFMMIDYNDMVNNWMDTILVIQHFLGVEPQALKPKTFKQGKTALDELFTNPEAITNDLLKFEK